MTRHSSPFSSSLRLLVRDGAAPLLAISTFSIPANLAAEYAIYTQYGPDDFGAATRITGLVGSITIPLYAAVIVQSASSSTTGQTLSYSQLVSSALLRWARVFKARFIAALLVAMGTLAFVVPGVLLAIRYAFVEVVAIEESANGGEARRRSAALSSGRWRELLRLLVSVVVAAVLLAIVAIFPLEFWPQLDNFASAALGDVAFDVLLSGLYGGAWFIYSRRNEAQVSPALPEPIA